MVKIKVGPGHDRASVNFRSNVPKDSSSEFEFGDSFDDARLQIDIFERDVDLLKMEMDKLQALLADGQATLDKQLRDEVAVIAAQADEAVRSRNWLAISAEGLSKAVRLISASASPVAASALKVIELVEKLRHLS